MARTVYQIYILDNIYDTTDVFFLATIVVISTFECHIFILNLYKISNIIISEVRLVIIIIVEVLWSKYFIETILISWMSIHRPCYRLWFDR